MKRLLIIGLLCLMALTVRAQRCAVLDFQIGTGVTEEEIDGLTYNFRANFGIDGYTVIPRPPILRTIETLGFNRTDMTQQQMLKVGRELEAKLIVVGTMNKFMDEYSVDIRAIDVSTGVTCANEGATFDKSSYRASMENLAAKLGDKLAKYASSGSSDVPVSPRPSPTPAPTTRANYTESAYGINMNMVFVKGGEFLMGGTSEQGGDAASVESPIRRVTVSDFYIGQFEVTQSQWESVMGSSVSQQCNKAGGSLKGTGPNYPMYYVSWEEAMEFCRILSRKTGKKYSLPTEAEWEYAARGGQKSDHTKYSGSNLVDYAAWYDGNSSSSTHPVGTKSPNELDIYDMSGNVWEWCSDWYGSYNSNEVNNPTGPASGSARVLRGGGWADSATFCRVSYRSYDGPGDRLNDSGFRVVCRP